MMVEKEVHPGHNKKQKIRGNRFTIQNGTEFICINFCESIKSNDNYGMPCWLRSVYVQKHDDTLISRSEGHTSVAVKQGRINTSAEQSALKEFQEEEEGVLYEPGIADRG
ncbi:hypothetical protein TNCT_34731 [Trichonephila clavata]|uniref:Uncharacterized protein n=1 Tax=Trichonephila clavata TaxID=2740835 RepID=A0A8X6GD47_TRICU|nr:hypothetical protein TNCT_34731 [Trichonephila clavata]